MRLDTKVLHAGVEFDKLTGAVSVPIYQASTFRQQAPGVHAGHEYARSGNPTRDAVESLIATLENGARGLAFASGMAAITTAFLLFSRGDHLIVSDDLYGGTVRLLDKIFSRLGISYTPVDASDPRAIEREIRPETRAVYLESPTNPLLKVADLEAVSGLTRRKGLLLIVDNTLMTPYWQLPLELGADIVLHSATKYLGGHSDLLAGAVVAREASLGEELHFLQNATGGVLAPHDSWLLMRGIKTLAIRMDRHEQNARELAPWLRSLPEVTRVYYPGLADHPGHAIAKRQARGFGGMISFEMDSAERASDFLRRLKLITLAESLGGVESLISLPSRMTHASIPPEQRLKLGIVDRLVRLSVGIEACEDLKEDILQALEGGKP